MTEQEIDLLATRMASELEKVLRATGGTGRGTDEAVRARKMRQTLQDLEKFNKRIEKAGDNTEYWSKNIDQNIAEAERLQEEMSSLGMDTGLLRKGVGTLEAQLTRLNRARQFEAAGRATASFATTTLKAGSTFAKGLVDTLSNAETEFGSAGGVMSAASTASTMAVSSGIKLLGVFGKMIPFVGDGLGKAAEYAEKAAQKLGNLSSVVMPVLIAEMEKNIRTFDTMTKSGALFTNGMTGMRDAVAAMDIPLATFSKGVDASSAQLAKSGMTSAEAVQRISAAFGYGDKMLKTKLRSLGFSYDEQVEMMAQVAADARASNNFALLADPVKLAAATEKYATNLTVLSGLVGKEAKAKLEETRRQNAQFQFRNEVAKMGLSMESVNAAMAGLPEQMKTGIQQLFGTGAISDPVVNQMMAMVPGFKESIDAVVNSMRSGTINTKEGVDDLNIQLAGFRKTMNDANTSGGNLAVGIASLHGAIPELTKGIQDTLDYALGPDSEATKKIIEAANQQKASSDELTKGITAASAASAKLAADMEQMVNESGAVAKFAKALEWSARVTTESVKELYDLLPNKVKGSLPPPSTTDYGAMSPESGGAPKFSNGGIANMPTTGGLAVMHGIEAVVPLPDGKSIPAAISLPQEIVDIMKSSTPEARSAQASMNLQPLVDKMNEQNNLLRAQIGLNQQVVDKLTETIKVNKNILAYTR